jgi:hypothetical protein
MHGSLHYDVHKLFGYKLLCCVGTEVIYFFYY